jgi:hypothetical protein
MPHSVQIKFNSDFPKIVLVLAQVINNFFLARVMAT